MAEVASNGGGKRHHRIGAAAGGYTSSALDCAGAPEMEAGAGGHNGDTIITAASDQDPNNGIDGLKNGGNHQGHQDQEDDSDGGPFGQSPRYEAYLMTGEKMLRLNSKISPNYAKMKQAELPRHTEVLTPGGGSPQSLYRGPFADLDKQQHYRRSNRRPGHNGAGAGAGGLPMPPSQSENGLAADITTSSSTKAASILTAVLSASNNQQQQQASAGATTTTVVAPSAAAAADDGSIVTVHGGFSSNHRRGGDCWKASSSEVGGSRATLQSGDLVGVGRAMAAAEAEMPSPTSPSYYSEPVSPARFAFVGGRSPPADDKDSPAQHHRRHHHKTHHQQQNGDAAATTLIINVRQQDEQQEQRASAAVTRGQDSEDSEDHQQQGSSPTASVQSTPLKERMMQRLESASRSSSLSTTAGGTRELDAEAARRLAKRLYALEGFRKSDVAKHLVKNNEFSNLVASEYLKQFNFAGLRLDAALRKFLHHFALTGETSERERIISYFSQRYYQCNPGLFTFEDEVHTLTCALLLLNTDLHNQNVPKRMSCHDFIENISQAGYTFSRDLLRALYQSIKNHPIEWAKDDYSETDTMASGLSSRGGLDSRLLEMPDPDSQVEYKKGWVMRKCVIDEDGKPMPFGRRSWRMFYATLKGMVLYLHKDEHGFKKSSYQTFRNAIRIHHALASRASDYIKKQHVFRLHTAGLAEYLFQTSDPKEMQSWIDGVNFVAASFSAPALPPAVSARQSFHRPLLPTAPTRLSMKEQCEVHQARINDLERMLQQHRNAAPVRTAKPRLLQEYAEKEIFLLFDLQKYTTYNQVLKARLDEQQHQHQQQQWDRSKSTDLMQASTSSTLVSAEGTTSGVCLVDAAGGGGGRLSSGQSGQSDRLSYRAAISCTMGPDPSSGGRVSYETNL